MKRFDGQTNGQANAQASRKSPLRHLSFDLTTLPCTMTIAAWFERRQDEVTQRSMENTPVVRVTHRLTT